MNIYKTLESFINQSHSNNLKTSQYPKEWGMLRMKVSFGMGMPARVPWIAFTSKDMQVSNGIYPVYLYYKQEKILILSYGISETESFKDSWPIEVINSSETIKSFFNKEVPRYGDSFVFRAYKVDINDNKIKFIDINNNNEVHEKDLESELEIIINYYEKILTNESKTEVNLVQRHGLFYMEKQLEDFIIHNWDQTELGKQYNLIIEEGEVLSQQFKTDIGRIDILATDKKTNEYVVIELKKDQTSDDTIGQLARYMGWIKENKKVNNVKGIIIAGEYDKKLDYALKIMNNIDVYLYKVDFKLEEFKN